MVIDQSSRVPLSPESLSITVRVQVPSVDSASKSEGVKVWICWRLFQSGRAV